MLIALRNSFSAIKKTSKFNKLLNTPSNDKNEALELSLKETNEAQHTTLKTEKELMRYIKLSKKLVKVTIALVTTSILLYMSLTFTIYKPLSLASKFELDITMIYPYVEESKIHELKSDWVSMRSKAEYIEIYDYIKLVKEKFSLPN